MSPQAQKLTLNAEVRTVLGKGNRTLRRKGLIPANIYGTGFDSQSIQIDLKTFLPIYKQAGETTVLYAKVDTKEYPTLVGDIQYHPVTGEMLHIDLRKVNLKQKIEANVPLVFIGESAAVATLNGVLLTQIEEITVLALPTDIPHEISIDISQLVALGDMIRVADLPASSSYEILGDKEQVIVSVSEHIEEEIEPETATEAPEIITEKPSEEPAADTEKGSE